MKDPRPYPPWWYERAAKRKAELDRAVETLRRALPGLQGVLGALVFGSYSRGEVGPESDLDILLIRDTEAPFHSRGDDFRLSVQLGVPYDLIVYTPSEFERLKRERTFVAQAVREGTWIDASASSR